MPHAAISKTHGAGKKTKGRNRQKKIVLTFDENARKDYLLGFRKRKNERRKKAKEQNEKKIKEQRQALKQQARDLRKYDKHRVPEVEHLVDTTTHEYDLPDHTVSITDIGAVDLGGQGGLRLGFNSGLTSSETETACRVEDDNKGKSDSKAAEELKKKQKQIKHKLSQIGGQGSSKKRKKFYLKVKGKKGNKR